MDTWSSYKTLSVLWLHIVTCEACVLCTQTCQNALNWRLGGHWESVWTFCRIDKGLAPLGNRTPPPHDLVTTLAADKQYKDTFDTVCRLSGISKCCVNVFTGNTCLKFRCLSVFRTNGMQTEMAALWTARVKTRAWRVVPTATSIGTSASWRCSTVGT